MSAEVSEDERDLVAQEHAALRRVATLVARGVSPAELFAAVAEEVGRLFHANAVGMLRHDDGDDMVALVGAWTELPVELPVGARRPLADATLRRVLETGRPARSGPPEDRGGFGPEARSLRIQSAIGAPIVIEGRVWGALVGSSTEPNAFAEASESRLMSFAELIATAVANAESRQARDLLLEEQSALRRVATLVARGVPPEEVFAAVTEEIGRLVRAEITGLLRFEPDETVTVIAAWSASDEPLPIGTRERASTPALRTVREIGQPARVHVPRPEDPFAESAARLGVKSTVAVPVVVEGRIWAAITASTTRPEPFPEETEARMTGFTELVATAIANADSRAELAASRRRIVTAADETRRRIERDLHDGIQQRLVSLALELRAAESLAPPELRELGEQLQSVAAGLQEAFDELREITRGIHPAILSQAGLGPALRALARRSALPVEVDVRTRTRLEERVEVAAYYAVSEALTNAIKHARASSLAVEVELVDGALRLTIRDDGTGGADPARGSGLIGLRDRIEALGGTLAIFSPAGAGTTLTIALPTSAA